MSYLLCFKLFMVLGYLNTILVNVLHSPMMVRFPIPFSENLNTILVNVLPKQGTK